MKYLADIFTALRLVAVPVAAWAILTQQWLLSFLVIAFASLTDAVDGYCARRWPYTAEDEARLPWRRIDPHMLDNGPDLLLSVVTMVCMAIVIPYWRWLIAGYYVIGVSFFLSVEVLVRRGRVRAAEMTDVVFGYWYAVSLVAVIVQAAVSGQVLLWALAIGAPLGALILWKKWDRATTRPETRERAMRYAS